MEMLTDKQTNEQTELNQFRNHLTEMLMGRQMYT